MKRFSIIVVLDEGAFSTCALAKSINDQSREFSDTEIILIDYMNKAPSLEGASSIRRIPAVGIGVSDARNLALEMAEGEWITFPEAGATLPPSYLACVDDFLLESECEMVSVRTEVIDTVTGRHRNHHTQYRFRGRNNVVDLDIEPTRFPSTANSSFFRLDRIKAGNVRFDHRVKPDFEDGHFCWRYLLSCPEPAVGYVSNTSYQTFCRHELDWLFRHGVTPPGLYDEVPRFTYLEAIETAKSKIGYVPIWIQNFILYELYWYFLAQDRGFGGPTELTPQQTKTFLDLLRRIRAHLDDIHVESFSTRKYKREWRDILLHGLSDISWHTPYAALTDFDHQKNQVCVSYRYTGASPLERISLGRDLAPIAFQKTRALNYFGKALLWERIFWIQNTQPFLIEIDGRGVEICPSWPKHVTAIRSTAGIIGKFKSKRGTKKPSLFKKIPAFKLPTRTSLINSISHALDEIRLLASRLPQVRRRYADAWIIMDRLHDANDSGEILFHYLQKNRLDINSWFAIEKGTPDWKRLKKNGCKNVLSYDSFSYRLAMLHCKHVISTHLTVGIHRPPNILRLRKPDWKFTFLQHGVIKDDISRWVNKKKIDLFITSTPDEHRSIVDDGSPYVFTEKETKLDGLARFDKLYESWLKFEGKTKDIILIAPTWRSWLHDPLQPGSFRREMSSGFEKSEFAKNWLSLIRSPDLHQLARENDLRIVILPHSNIKELFDSPDIAPGCEIVGYEREDIRDFYANAIAFVTDYSSTAFNAAFLKRPVVYFQFDRDRVIAGGHQGRKGYFDYVENGYGPVTQTVSETIAKIDSLVLSGGVSPEPYRTRLEAAFTIRDGRCCERITASIEDLYNSDQMSSDDDIDDDANGDDDIDDEKNSDFLKPNAAHRTSEDEQEED